MPRHAVVPCQLSTAGGAGVRACHVVCVYNRLTHLCFLLSGVFGFRSRVQAAGFELQRRYGRAFDKVVQTIKTDVLPILLPKKMVSERRVITKGVRVERHCIMQASSVSVFVTRGWWPRSGSGSASSPLSIPARPPPPVRGSRLTRQVSGWEGWHFFCCSPFLFRPLPTHAPLRRRGDTTKVWGALTLLRVCD